MKERYVIWEKYDKYIRSCNAKTKNKSNYRFWLGNTLRFAIKVFYLIIRPFLPNTKNDFCDILLIGAPANTKRFEGINQILRNAELRIKVFKVENEIDYVKKLFSKNNLLKKVPANLFIHYLIAEYFVNKYKPKVLCTFAPMGVGASLFTHVMQKTGKTVFIPHSIAGFDYRYSSTDHDYYLVFGESSIVNLKKNTIRIGNTKAVKVGSPFINYPTQEPNLDKKSVLFFSSSGTLFSKDKAKYYKILEKWAAKNTEIYLLIKLHPLENDNFAEEVAKKYDNVTVLDTNTKIDSAIKQVSCVISTWSNASIEAAYLKRPSVIFNITPYNENSDDFRESDKFLYLEKYFPKRAANAEELQDRIETVFNNYDYYLEQCEKFVKYHLEYTHESPKVIANVIQSIAEGKEDFPYIEMEENVELLKSNR